MENFRFRFLGYHAKEGEPFGDICLFDLRATEPFENLDEAQDFIKGFCILPITVHAMILNQPVAQTTLSVSIVHSPDGALTKKLQEKMGGVWVGPGPVVPVKGESD